MSVPTWKFTNGQTLNVGTMYCIGRNYAAHAREMGADVPEDPIVFLKPPSAYVESSSAIVLPPWTTNVHHEVEIVVVLGESGIAGYGIGLDLTARDVQARAKQKGEPWAVAKGWLGSAPVSHVVPAEEVVTQNLTFSLDVNGERRQTGTTANMERTIPELLAYLKTVFGLRAGDAIFTGTPEGVAQLHAGDIAVAQLDGYTSLSVSFV
ncbi:MAG TPA: isomerase/hydrolase [Bacteroidetes bacterium]|nr:isomerase/hydrolase [Bacteroidota bacterium]HRK04417.1 fumarylacetoacetate hydrolase family protein [Chlorobiota bacterium]